MTSMQAKRVFAGACISFAAAFWALGQQPPAAPAANLGAAMAAYAEGKFQQAGDALKALEENNGRAAGIVCELFVRKLLPPDDERGSAACETAGKMKDPHGLMWRGLAGRDGYASLGLSITEAATLGNFAQAAELDYPPAFGRLCEHYYRKQSFKQAVPFCKYAGGRGVPDALYYYALMTIDGKGVVQDFRKGVNALLLSAQLKSESALAKLSELSRHGASGMAKNPVKAYTWILLASSVDPNSKAIAEQKQSQAQEIGPDKVAQTQKNASAWIMSTPPTTTDFYPAK